MTGIDLRSGTGSRDAADPALTGPVVVIGAGGLGEEVCDAVIAAGRTFAGFLDDAPNPAAVGQVSSEAVPDGAFAILAVGSSETRWQLAARLEGFTRWATVIHPTAVVSARCVIGPGSFIGPLAYVGPLAVIGSHAVVNVHAEVGHHATVGDFATLSPLCALNGAVHVGEGAFLGTAVTVEPQITIGQWSRLAATCHVVRDCGDGFLLYGNPASGRQMFRPPVAERAKA